MPAKNFTEFNAQAALYARFRPSYPSELFDYLAGLCPSHDIAFDVGTGNGQCAVDLAKTFARVHASDFSEEQIRNAMANPRVKYFVAPAHESGLPDRSVDLVTAATAIHWFNHDLFYPEVKRILRPGGVIAVWAYGWHECDSAEINAIFMEIGQSVLMPYWSEPPKMIWNGYETLPFPFAEITPPAFESTADWTLAQFIGYLSTWSASQKFTEKNGFHPARDFYDRLLTAWGDPERVVGFRSPLHLKVGKV